MSAAAPLGEVGHIGYSPQTRTVRSAVLGGFTRPMLKSYAERVLIVIVALVSIALTFDISPWLPQVLGEGAQNGTMGAVSRVGKFVAIRSADIMTQVLPIGCFLGVLWAEIAHRTSREWITIANTGRSPLQCSIPLAIFAATLMVAQFVADAYVRPAAVMAQVAERLGSYGAEYDRGLSRDKIWVAAGDSLIHAQVFFGPPPAFHNLTVYRVGGGGLRQAVIAEEAVPIADGAAWLFRNGEVWDATPGSNRSVDARDQSSAFAERPLPLNVDTLWLSYFNIHAKYIPHADLRKLAGDGSATHPTVQYRTWVQIRYGNAALTTGLVLLARMLFLVLVGARVTLVPLLAVATAGYLGSVGMKVSMVLGENGYLHPLLAGWSIPIAVLALCGLTLFLVERKAGMLLTPRTSPR